MNLVFVDQVKNLNIVVEPYNKIIKDIIKMVTKPTIENKIFLFLKI